MLTLDQASKIVDVALAKGREMKLNPLTVAVLDAAGVFKAFKREDNSGTLRRNIAFGKAWATLGLGAGGRALAARAQATPHYYSAMYDVSGGRIIPGQGGVIIRDASGAILGAIGISGDSSENDETCAVHGVESVGLVADTGATP